MKEFIIKTIKGFRYAIQGIVSALLSERNMKIHVAIMILVIIAGFILKISCIEWIVCIILFACVISAEMFNTAIEKTIDIVIPEKSDKVKFIKDVSAGAVFVIAIASAIIGIIIFLPKIIAL